MVYPGSSPPRVGLTRASPTATQGRYLACCCVGRRRRGLQARHAPRPAAAHEHGRLECSTFVPAQAGAVTARGQRNRPERGYLYVAAWRGVCPIQVQGTIRGPALPGGRGPRMTGLLGTGPRATPLRVAPGKARGHVVYSQDETQHHCRPAAYHVTESDGYPHSAAGVWRRHERGASFLTSGPRDGLAHEPRRHGLRLACVAPRTLRRPGGVIHSSCQLDRDGCRPNERRAMTTVRLYPGRIHHVRPRDWEAQRSASTLRCLS